MVILIFIGLFIIFKVLSLCAQGKYGVKQILQPLLETYYTMCVITDMSLSQTFLD